MWEGLLLIKILKNQDERSLCDVKVKEGWDSARRVGRKKKDSRRQIT
jgi:hypothetical protein